MLDRLHGKHTKQVCCQGCVHDSTIQTLKFCHVDCRGCLPPLLSPVLQPTPEVAVFDLLGIPLVHGWLVDPQDSKTAAVFSNKSYNELVEMLFLVSQGARISSGLFEIELCPHEPRLLNWEHRPHTGHICTGGARHETVYCSLRKATPCMGSGSALYATSLYARRVQSDPQPCITTAA
jgi:hypothetical protein